MDDAAIKAFVLEKLGRWKRLTLSDLSTMLPPVDRPRLRRSLLDELAGEGRVTVRWLGDEPVVALLEGSGEAPRTASLTEEVQ